MPELTIAFADLTGSVSVFESLGNDQATQTITRLTQWIGTQAQEHGGTVVKVLGDGVLLSFTDSRQAVEAVVHIQHEHSQRANQWPASLQLQLQVGIACGQVVVVDGDCFGDAVNLASRLSDLAGPEQILASDKVIERLGSRSGVRHRNLGPIQIRGKNEPTEVYRIEWQAELHTDFLTMPADLHVLMPPKDAMAGGIELAWLEASVTFSITDLPLHIGRVPGADFMVADPRVSRLHARIDYRSGNYVLEDVSSYGTWVRFAGSETLIPLRRQDCLLHSGGDIAMGAPFTDFSAPTVRFRLINGAMVLSRGAG